MAINAGDTTYYQAKRGIVQDGLVLTLDAAVDQSYPGNGTTWYDLSPSGISATLYNGAVLNRDKGGVIAFDGTDDYAQTADVNLGPSGSISIFVKWNDNTASYFGSFLCHGYEGAGLFRIGQTASSTTMQWYLRGTGNVQYAIVNGTLPVDNEYHHLFMTWDDTNIISYIDNVELLNTGHSLTLTGFYDTIDIASIRAGLSQSIRYVDADIANICIWNRTLSSSEVEQTYNSLIGRFE